MAITDYNRLTNDNIGQGSGKSHLAHDDVDGEKYLENFEVVN